MSNSVFGPFKQSLSLLRRDLWKKDRPLSVTRKRNIRKQLALVDANVEVLNSVNIPVKALALFNAKPKEYELRNRYCFNIYCKSAKNHLKKWHLTPHYPKAEHPRGYPAVLDE